MAKRNGDVFVLRRTRHGTVLLAEMGILENCTQPLADFASAPTGVLVLDVQNVVLDQKRKLVGVTIGTPTSVGEPVNPRIPG